MKQYLYKRIFEVFKTKMEFLFGWLEVAFKQNSDYQYKYVMERIELKETHEKMMSIVHYKFVGCRKLHSKSAVELNKSAVFILFRPDHAQMIVSIATAEALVGISTEEINNKYKKYISHCNFKLNGTT